jgi:hypothetical protein
MTINTGGPANRCPPAVLHRDSVTDLIDGFIRDGWIDAENRVVEIAAIYKGQRDAAHRDIKNIEEAYSRARYSQGWVDRYLDSLALLDTTCL